MSKNPHSTVCVRKATIPFQKTRKTVMPAEGSFPSLDLIVAQSTWQKEKETTIHKTHRDYPALSKIKGHIQYAGHRFFVTRKTNGVEILHLGERPKLF